MAATITSVRKLVNGGEATQTQNGESVKRQYLATVTQKDADPLEVARATHASMPAYNSADSINTSLIVTKKTAKRVPTSSGKPSKNHWVVDVEWSLPLGPTGSTSSSTAESNNIKVRITSIEQTILTQMGLTDDNTPTPILNSVYDLYPDAQEIPIYDTLIEVDYESDNMNNALWDAAIGKINDGTVTLTLPQGNLTYTRTFPIHTILLKTAEREVTISKTDPTSHVWSNKVQIIYREDTWDRTLPDKGYRWFVTQGAEEVTTNFRDHAEYLDGEGHKLAADAELVRLDPVQVLFEHDLETVLETI